MGALRGSSSFSAADDLLAALRNALEKGEELLRRVAEHGVGIVVTGPPGSGKSTLIAALASRLGSELRLHEQRAGSDDRLLDVAVEEVEELEGKPCCAVLVESAARPAHTLEGGRWKALLDRFERVYLVLNLSSREGALLPDESSRLRSKGWGPLAVEEVLAAPSDDAELASAVAEGRLRIHAVDLQAAAEARRAHPSGDSSLSALVQDLVNGLDEHRQTSVLVGDALRRAEMLLDEIVEACRDPIAVDFTDRWRRFEPARTAQAGHREALQSLERITLDEWVRAFEPLQERLRMLTKSAQHEARRRASRSFDEALQAWFCDDQSLFDLLSKSIGPINERHREETWRASREILVREATQPATLACLPQNLQGALEGADVLLSEIASSAAAELPHEPLFRVKAWLLESSDLPLRRGLTGRMGLSRPSSLRERLLGPADCPDRPLTREEKARRLAKHARNAMKEGFERRLEEQGASTIERSCASMMRVFLRSMIASLSRKIDAKRRRLDSELARLDGLLTDPGDPGRTLLSLEEWALAARSAVNRLRSKYGWPVTPAEPGVVIPVLRARPRSDQPDEQARRAIVAGE